MLNGNCISNTTSDAATNFFNQFVTTVLTAQCALFDLPDYPKDVNIPDEQYDFIIVGAGTAGSVVASRLSENENFMILLIEAGKDPPLTSRVPLLRKMVNSDNSWAYKTEVQEYACLGIEERRCQWTTGKVLGGTSATNGMIYNRGNKRDYDRWESMGNEGWGYQDVLEYFKKSETIKSPHKDGDKYHGTKGPLTVSRFTGYPESVTSSLLEAAKELGLETDDINGEKQTGFTIMDATISDGTRMSVAEAFLVPAKDRKNLHVLKNALATRILFDSTKRATGIEYIKAGRMYTVGSRKEVIVSAGTINTPQLLMLSGIGPEDHLTQMNIPVVANLFVGYNLQDHYFTFTPTFKLYPSEKECLPDTELFKTCSSGIKIPLSGISGDPNAQQSFDIISAFEYLINRKGPLAGIGIFALNGNVKSNFADETDDYPDLQCFFSYLPKGSLLGGLQIGKSIGFTPEAIDHIFGSVQDSDILTIGSIILRPNSRGRITLQSKDPTIPPKIQPNYLSVERDVDILLDAIKFAINFTTGTEALGRRQCACLVNDSLPSCAHFAHGTEDYWRCVVRHLSSTGYHHVGTAKMGSKSDPDSVVDPRLLVKGVSNLRVIDASIMPTIVSGNPMAPTIMIGEKGADLIKEDWQKRQNGMFNCLK